MLAILADLAETWTPGDGSLSYAGSFSSTISFGYFH
jgi:hypothetical protein